MATQSSPGTPRKVIVLAAFGTLVSEAAQTLEAIEKRVRARHSGTEVRWSFTSKTIRSRMASRGSALHSPETLLAGLMSEGYTQAAVLSLHVVPGVEFHELHGNVQRFAGMSGGFEKIAVATPLLCSHDDMTRVADILARDFAPEGPDAGTVFIGHGNRKHPSDAIYLAMNSMMTDRNPRLFVGTVAGHPTPGELLPKLANAGVRHVRLVPLMTAAGNHARKDMAGDEPGSWKSFLADNGITSEPVFRGLAEAPEIVAIWLEHLDDALSRL